MVKAQRAARRAGLPTVFFHYGDIPSNQLVDVLCESFCAPRKRSNTD